MAPLKSLQHKLKPPLVVKVRLPPKRTNPFYLSSAWRDLIERIKLLRGARCQDVDHRPEHPRSGVRLYGDHIRELKDGGAPLDQRNVLLRCPPCHQRKTAAERAKRYHSKPGGPL